MGSHATPPRGWVSFAASTLALLYGVAFLAWGLTDPAWNGYEPLAAQSLLVAAPMWLLVRRHCSTGSRAAGLAAELIAAAFMAWAFFGGFSIAFGTFPAAVLVLVAVLAVPRGTPSAAIA